MNYFEEIICPDGIVPSMPCYELRNSYINTKLLKIRTLSHLLTKKEKLM